jgi:hypothetical protein
MSFQFQKYKLLCYFAAIFLLALYSCRAKPSLKEERYKEALVKIHECEAYHELKLGNNQPAFIESCKAKALKDLTISPKDFEQTTQYYKAHPKEFEVLYDSLLIKNP